VVGQKRHEGVKAAPHWLEGIAGRNAIETVSVAPVLGSTRGFETVSNPRPNASPPRRPRPPARASASLPYRLIRRAGRRHQYEIAKAPFCRHRPDVLKALSSHYDNATVAWPWASLAANGLGATLAAPTAR